MGLCRARTSLTARGSEKKKEKGCFPSLVAAEAGGRVGSSSCGLHICRAHMIQNLLTALVPHVETRTHTPTHFSFSFFPLAWADVHFPVLPRAGKVELCSYCKAQASPSCSELLVLPASPHLRHPTPPPAKGTGDSHL